MRRPTTSSTRTTRAGARPFALLTRALAAIALIGLTVVLPAVVWHLVGGLDAVAWGEVVRSRRIDGDTVVALGLVVFALLWAWFAVTAISEVAHVLTWRQTSTAVLPPVEATPSGAIRRLVRAALLSTTTVVGAGVASLTGAVGAGASAPTPVVWTMSTTHTAAPATPAVPATQPALEVEALPTSLRSTGRDTPYSVAVRLGDPALRDRIIELNHGAVTPDGGTWTGGVFPAGMVVEVPAGLLDTRPVAWEPYTVVEGDSVYRIATRLAAGDHLRVRDLADQIIERNLGRTMLDGKVFDDPSLVRVGWVLDVPVATPSGSVGSVAPSAPRFAGGPTHLVEPGESYWSIAEQTVDPPGDVAAVAELTHELLDHNAPLLGYDQPAMLHPGDHVELPAHPYDVFDDHPDVIVHPTAVTPEFAPTPEAPETPETPETPEAPETTPPAAPETSAAAPAASTPESTTPTTPVPPAVPAVPAGPAADGDSVRSTRPPVTTSLAAAVLLCAGALGLVESRRRQQLRRASTHARVIEPGPRVQRIERLVRSLDATQRAVRLDLALRSAGHLLAGTGGYVLAAIVGDDGGVDLLLDRPGRVPSDIWEPGDRPERWHLPADTFEDDLARTARLAGQPCPAVVHLGRVTVDDGRPGDGDLFVDLEAFGLVCVDDGTGEGQQAVDTDAVLRALATSLAASPVGETLRLVTHDLDASVHLGNFNAETADDLDAALDLAAASLGSTPTAIGHRRTFELRARGIGGEAWEPVVVVSAARRLDASVRRELAEVTRGGGRGLAVVLGRPVDGASLTLRATATGWDLDRLGITVVPVGLEPAHVADLRHLLYAADQPVLDVPVPVRSDADLAPFVEPAWQLMVRVLGLVDVIDHDGGIVPFDRGKSLELTAWLAQHRRQSTRGAARAALWEHDVRDATFANVVSDARRSLARAVPPADGEEWIGRTLTDHLPIHDGVITDAEVLQARLDASRGRDAAGAIEVLLPGVALIRDQPFAGTDYLWPHAEGITSSLVLLATTAATELARHHLALGDVDGVFWATGQGLRVLPGHEELIGLRMRAHAQRGDLSGVRQEWEAYERAITADAWSDGEPSPKLLALRRELLNR